MKRIYAVDEDFIRAYNGEEITDAEWVERSEDLGKVWSSPSAFAFDLRDGEVYKELYQLRVIDLEGDYDESNDRFDRPVLFVPTELTKRGMDEVTIADLAVQRGEVYDDFAEFVTAFNNATTPHAYQMQMFIGSMTLEMMQEILNTLGKKEDDDKVAVRLTQSQVEDIILLILGESTRTRVVEDSIVDSATKKSLAEYRERLLGTMKDIHAQLPNE